MSVFSRLKRLISKKSRSAIFDDRVAQLIADRYPQFDIGYGSYGDLDVIWQNTGAALRMGKFCSVAKGVQVFLGGEHRPDWVTTYPLAAISKEFPSVTGYPHTKGDVIIGNDVWICHEAMILSGVKIGDGAVIGARAVVTRDVPPYAIVSGNPARLIRYRFDDAIIEQLLAICWWDWPQERIAAAVPQLLNGDIAGFIARAKADDHRP